MKFLRVVGARPQFMQAAVLSTELAQRGFSEVILHTGQHYDKNMSDTFFEELKLAAPHYNLNIGSAGHAVQTGQMLEGIEAVLLGEKPDAVIVDGDTNSTLAGALAAAKLHIPTVHVEAGLRSYNKKMPEEINRIVTDHTSALLCVPTQNALANLKREGLADKSKLTGDLMYDCFLQFEQKAKSEVLASLELKPQEYILATIHRAENTDSSSILHEILQALQQMPFPVVMPCHPRTAKLIKEQYHIECSDFSNIKFIEPVSYLSMIALEKSAAFIVTDSGGVQREAYFAKVPSVIVRNETEWVEQVEAGWSVLGFVTCREILDAVDRLQKQDKLNPDIYGGGQAAKKIVDAIVERFA